MLHALCRPVLSHFIVSDFQFLQDNKNTLFLFIKYSQNMSICSIGSMISEPNYLLHKKEPFHIKNSETKKCIC